MSERTRIINGVTVRDITPELTPEEERKRINELAANLLAFGQNKESDKTA